METSKHYFITLRFLSKKLCLIKINRLLTDLLTFSISDPVLVDYLYNQISADQGCCSENYQQYFEVALA